MMGVLLRGVIFCLSVLPPGFARELCAQLASLYARVGGPRTKDAYANIRLAFPEKSDEGCTRILVESFANLGRSVAEVCSMHRRDSGALFDRVTIEGRENLELARKSSGQDGGLVVTAHFGSWEFCAAALAHHGLPISVVQHGFKNAAVERVVTDWRAKAGLETLSMGSAALGLFRALGRGRYVALLMDQNAGEEEGVFAPFFSVAASTRSGPALIAMTRGTPVIPVFFYRKGKTGEHVARIGAPLELDQDENAPPELLTKNVACINAAIEAAIREAPEQWIWSHRRFKTRPAGAEPIYEKRGGVLRSLRHRLRG
jgi:KDO2-lipid IV(A) lauroyltransferase